MWFRYGVVIPIRLAFEKVWAVQRKENETFERYMNRILTDHQGIENDFTYSFEECIQWLFRLGFCFALEPNRSYRVNHNLVEIRFALYTFTGFKYAYIGSSLDAESPDGFQLFSGTIKLLGTKFVDDELKRYGLYEYVPQIWYGLGPNLKETDVSRNRLN